MKGKYIKPSELLKLQKETGKSYWDLIGRPLGKKPKDPAKDVVDEYDPVLREALRMLIESALDYPQYKSGKSSKVKTWNDNDVADLIIGFEGFLPHAKDIGDGKITIGSGLTNPKYTRFGTITPEQNRRFVLEEIAARKARLSRNVPGWNTLPGSAKAALLSYDYGWMVDRKTSPKMMKALLDRNWPEVANQMNAGWNMKKFKKGLRKRRTQERNLFLSDLYRPAPLKPIQTVSPMPEAKVPFEVTLMEDKIAPIVNQQQPIVPYTSSIQPVELLDSYNDPKNDMASIDLENTSRINPNDILLSYYNMFGYKRGKSIKTLIPVKYVEEDPQYIKYMEDKSKQIADSGAWANPPYEFPTLDEILTQMLNDNTYSYKTWWDNATVAERNASWNDKNPFAHWTDIAKTAYHPTFSNESIFSGKKSDYNPKGIEGGRWVGDYKYILSQDQIDNNWDIDKTKSYLNLAESKPVKVIVPNFINSILYGYKRGKSFPFLFWNRAGNTMQLQR